MHMALIRSNDMSSVETFYQLRDKLKRKMTDEEEDEMFFRRKKFDTVADEEADFISASVIAAAELLSRILPAGQRVSHKRQERCRLSIFLIVVVVWCLLRSLVLLPLL